jgi:hypothetical protein
LKDHDFAVSSQFDLSIDIKIKINLMVEKREDESFQSKGGKQ